MGLGTKWDEEELILTWLTGIQKATPSVKSWQKGLLWCEVIRAPNTCILQKVVESRNACAAQNHLRPFLNLDDEFSASRLRTLKTVSHHLQTIGSWTSHEQLHYISVLPNMTFMDQCLKFMHTKVMKEVFIVFWPSQRTFRKIH